MVADHCRPLPDPSPDHRQTSSQPPYHQSTTSQWWLTASQRPGKRSGQRGQAAMRHATSAATSACRSYVSLRGNATSSNWVLLAYVAATLAVDVVGGIITLLHGSNW
ncbi:hypothetical protein Tco_1410282 [Tanacetum coccineum]